MNKSELSEQEKIKKLENLPFLSQWRMNLVLVFLGEKPATTVEIGYSMKRFLEEVTEDLKIKKELEEVLTEARLKFKILEEKQKSDYGFDYTRFDFLISRDIRIIEELEKAMKEDDHKKLGLLYGYPETAVKAFVKAKKGWRKFQELMLDENAWWENLTLKEKRKYSKEGFLYFKSLKLSKKDYKKEFETLKRWQKVLEEKAPSLVKEIVSEKDRFFVTKKEKKEYKKKIEREDIEGARKKIEKAVNDSGKLIEGGIKETVVMLDVYNIRTDQSCEGYFEKGKEIGPWVLVCPKEPEKENWREDKEIVEIVKKWSLMMRKRLINILNKFYEKRKVSFDTMLGFSDVGYGFKLQSMGNEVLEIFSIDPKKKKEKFKAYKREMRDFTNFLKKNCFDSYKF